MNLKREGSFQKDTNGPRVKCLKMCIGSLIDRCKQKNFAQSHCLINIPPRISLLPLNAKLLETVFHSCLLFLISNSPLRIQQYGFCLLHSTDLDLSRILSVAFSHPSLLEMMPGSNSRGVGK